MTKKIARFAAVALLLGLVLLAATFLLGIRQQARAHAFLDAVLELKLGEATFQDARLLARRYGGRPWTAVGQEATCTPEECYLDFNFPNPRNYLPFWLVSRVAFNGILHVKQDRIVGIELTYQIDSKFGHWSAYDVQDILSEEPASSYQRIQWLSLGYGIANVKLDMKGAPWFGEVILNRHSTQEERERAYSLDFSCLARIYDCTRPSDIFPPGWRVQNR